MKLGRRWRWLLVGAGSLADLEGRGTYESIRDLSEAELRWPLRHVCADPYCPAKRAEGGGWPQPEGDT